MPAKKAPSKKVVNADKKPEPLKSIRPSDQSQTSVIKKEERKVATFVEVPQVVEAPQLSKEKPSDSDLHYWQQVRMSQWQKELQLLTNNGLPIFQVPTSYKNEDQQLNLQSEPIDRISYELQICKALAPKIEGFIGTQNQLSAFLLESELQVDWNFLQKDIVTLIKVIAKYQDYVPSLGLRCWQLRNMTLIYDVNLRQAFEKARQQRSQISKKIVLLQRLIQAASHIDSIETLAYLSQVEDEFLDLSRKELEEAIRADHKARKQQKLQPKPEEENKIVEQEMEERPQPKPATPKIQTIPAINLLKFYKTQARAPMKQEMHNPQNHPLFQQLQQCSTEASRIQERTKLKWTYIEELIQAFVSERHLLPPRQVRTVNYINVMSDICYINHQFKTGVDVNPRNPHQKSLQLMDRYEIDSESELEEARELLEDPDDIESDEQSAKESDDLSCVEGGFIVPDFYFSDSELEEIDGDVIGFKEQIRVAGELIAQRRKNITTDMTPVYQNTDLEEYAAVPFQKLTLPLSIVKPIKIVSKQVVEVEHFLPQVVSIVHGSELNKADLVQQIRKSVPELVGNNSKIKSFLRSQCVRQSVDGEPKKRQLLQLEKLETAFGDKAKDLNLEEILKSKIEKKDEVPQDVLFDEVSMQRPAEVSNAPSKSFVEAQESGTQSKRTRQLLGIQSKSKLI